MKTFSGKVRASMVIKLGGSYCAFMIGAGFATGQEILQYFTAYGFLYSTLGFILSLILGAWTAGAVMAVGYETEDVEGRNSYKSLCGKYLGTVLSYFIPIFMFLTLVIMIAGSGATFSQQFDLNPWLGSGIMAVLVAVVAFFGLKRVVDVVGLLGPAIIVISIVVGIIILITNPIDITESDAFVNSHEMYKAAGSWWLSSILYVLWGIVMGLPFMAAMGSKAISKKEIVYGTIVGNILFNLALACLSYAMAAQIDVVYDMSIPAVAMADSIHPAMGIIYSIILVSAIFTTAVPLLWSVVARIAKEKSKLYYIAIPVIAILGFFGGQLPFELLINYIYPLIGYLGFVVLAAIIWREIKMIRKIVLKKKEISGEETSGESIKKEA